MPAIADIELKSSVIVAPMAGISNGAFREICHNLGAGLIVSEMISDKAIYYRNEKTLKMLETDPTIHPVSLQIFGSDPETMGYAAKVLSRDTACDIIDINMGCPVNKVVKNGSGSALMKEEDKAVEVVRSVIANATKPVTVKMRLGYDHDHMNYLSLSKKLESIGVAAIALHARTRSQMYEGKADWSHIARLHKEVSIPVFGNGDIRSLEDYIAHKEDCDAVMIGRALIGNPFLIKEINDYEAGKEIRPVTYHDRIAMAIEHAKKLADLKGELAGMREFRGIGPHYIAGLYNAAVYKNAMAGLNSVGQLEELLKKYEDELNEKMD